MVHAFQIRKRLGTPKKTPNRSRPSVGSSSRQRPVLLPTPEAFPLEGEKGAKLTNVAIQPLKLPYQAPDVLCSKKKEGTHPRTRSRSHHHHHHHCACSVQPLHTFALPGHSPAVSRACTQPSCRQTPLSAMPPRTAQGPAIGAAALDRGWSPAHETRRECSRPRTRTRVAGRQEGPARPEEGEECRCSTGIFSRVCLISALYFLHSVSVWGGVTT